MIHGRKVSSGTNVRILCPLEVDTMPADWMNSVIVVVFVSVWALIGQFSLPR